MGEKETLRRVREDVDAGRLTMARQRLRGLVGSYPQRLDLREQLAELYRREGMLGQAGRWSFLSEDPDPVEVRAFEREYRDPVNRMHALAWRGPEAAGVSGQRQAALRAEAERRAGHEVPWERPLRPHSAQSTSKWGDRVFVLVALLVLGLMLVGGIAFLVEGIQTVLGWLSKQ